MRVEGFVLVLLGISCTTAKKGGLLIGQPTIIHPNQAPLLSMVPFSGQPPFNNPNLVFGSYPFNGGGYNIPGVFGAEGGLGWGLGGAGVMPGYADATRFGLPADYLLPKQTMDYWMTHQKDYRLPLYQGSHIANNGGFKGLRGRSLSRFRAVNPNPDPKVTLLNPLNHPNWFSPSALDPVLAPTFAPASQFTKP
eukprot:c13238_g1_i1.p1 GENE.c13238_g1_i1~~c13238_g1_i1.p1  ORF type:complete len:202 (+),score=35.89 c13238_g1_i1:26-607(+)